MPSVGLPSFSTTLNNQTYSFSEMCSHLGSGIIIVPLVSVLANVAIAKVFGEFLYTYILQKIELYGGDVPDCFYS